MLTKPMKLEKRICGGDHNFSILEVESTEDLCLTPQTGAVFSRKGTGEGRTGEEAVQQRASPAVDLLGGNSQAPQNVAWESPRHAQQPVAAAYRPSPPSNDPSTVLLPENKESAFLGMEKTLPTSPPESLSINISEDSTAEEVAAKEPTVQTAGVARTFPTSVAEDCRSTADIQRLPAAPAPNISITQIDTIQYLQQRSQTDEEKGITLDETNQIQPRELGSGLLAYAETEEKLSISLEYKSETATNMELVGKEESSEIIVPQPPSQICFTASPSSVQQSSVVFKVQDSTATEDMEQAGRDLLVDSNQIGHMCGSGAVWQVEGHQDLDSKPSPHSLLSSDTCQVKQTDPSKNQDEIIQDISNDASELQKNSSLDMVETTESVKAPPETFNRETQLTSLENPEIIKREILDGILISSETDGKEDSRGQKSSEPSEGGQLEGSTEGEQVGMSAMLSDFKIVSKCSTTQDSSSKQSVAPSMFDTGIVVTLQEGQVVEAETSHSLNQVTTTETPIVALTDAQEIVVVREGSHISEDWSNIHLNQSYILQREDGSVCEAAIVNELTAEPKLYEERVQSHLEMDSHPVEVYEFCGLVEEVAEETVCASNSTQIPHSPGYEVNLFNALLENSDEYTVKQDIEMHIGPSFHTINDGNTVIISQQPLHSSNDENQIEVLSTSNSHALSMQNPRVAAAVRQHLLLDGHQAVQVANSGEVCLVEVAAVTSDSFTVEQMGTSAHILAACSQVSAPLSSQTVVSASAEIQNISPKLETKTTANTSVTTATQSPVAISPHVPDLDNSEKICLFTHEGTKESTALSVTLQQNVDSVAVSTETKPVTFCTTHSPSIINPKLLLLKPVESPILKTPSSLLAEVPKQKGLSSNLANAHGSWSDIASKECLPQIISTADSPNASVVLRDQTQSSVNKTSAVEALSEQNATTKCDKEALLFTKTSPRETAALDSVSPMSDTHTHGIFEAGDGDVTSNSLDDPIGQSDSLFVEDECEDMDQDEPLGETEAQEDISGHASSAEEEGSDDDPDEDKTESEMTSPISSHKHGQSRTEKRALFLKVRQWIANRATLNSSPVSPSAGPSPTSDWSARRRERSSPLRDPHGKFVSPSMGGYSPSSDQTTPRGPRGHTDMAELAKHEADIEHRTQALKREGFWSMKRLTRLTEPMRPKVHWDYLCEEMQWLSADFAQERRWKRGVARKVVRMVVRHHEELRQKEEKAKRDEHAKIRKVASSIAKEVRSFWSNVEKVVQYKQQSRLEEKRKKALDLQLDFIVGQTEKYSDLLSKSLATTRPAETVPLSPQKSVPAAVEDDDRDFEPQCDEEDDEETIEVEEQQEGNDAESHRREIELLKEEGLLPLDQLLSTLKLLQDAGSEEESSGETLSSVEEEEEEEDGEFTANEEDANDEEDTIAAQEKIEGNVDHGEELDDLAKEGNLSIEELLERYKGAFAPDFEVPSESGSKASLDSEASGDEEVETEEDESDVESNTSSSDSPGDSAEEDNSEKEEEESAEEEDEDNCEDEGMELLLEEGDYSPGSSGSRPKKEISHIAATAESLQPKGYTLATTKVKTPIPFLLHGTLREYQHIGLDWLVTMYEKKLNGILADEMGLGKTIQTIALLAHLACEKGNWGPHLIIVPTSVMLNWEMELKRWCPGFKILTYFGSQKERKLKRQGWTKPNAFHVCITSYKLVLQDHQAFRRKSWRYLILDEAQNIKNFKSQRWQSLLNFNSHRRLLLTGTPLQNSLMELWSLMHFLMPHVFQSHREFKEWFSNPLTGMIEGSQEYNEGLVKRLHKVLRPFLLRRIKADVEKQMPKKYEHVVRCRLSKRQRFLYDDFMAQASTRETLASGHFMSVINILMQLRKVCNHPNLFDPRPIQSPFITQPIVFNTASLVQDALDISPLKRCDLSAFVLVGLERCVTRYQADVFLPRHKVSRQLIQEIMESPEPPPRPKPVRMKVNRMFQPLPKSDNKPCVMNKPTCSVPPAQTAIPPTIPEASPSPGPAPVVKQVVCSVTPTPPPRPAVQPNTQTAVRSTAPKPVLTVRPPAAPSTAGIPAHPSPNNMPQRVLLSPDMQARLPSGEVVSIAQLASLAGRPVSSCQGSKPVTFQLQGNKLTLSGAQIHQVSAASPRPIQGNVMHVVSSGVQRHLISQPAPVAVQGPVNVNSANTSSTAPANRLIHNVSAQVPSSMVSSAGVVKIVVRQSAGKEGGPVPTLAVAPSPRVTSSLSLHAHANTLVTPVRNTGPLQIAQRTPGPATAHYTIAPPRNPISTPSQPQPPCPVLKVVQTPPSITEKPAPANTSPALPKPVPTPQDGRNSQTPVTIKSRPSAGAKVYPPPRTVPHPPPRSPFYMPWLAESHKKQHDSRLDFIFRVNEQHCAAKPVYGQELLNILSFLHGPCPTPAPVSPEGEWKRSGHSACLLSQFPNKCNYWSQSQAVRKDIHAIEERLEMISDVIDRFAFVIPPVEAPQISMHCCHPPPSLSHKQAVYGSTLTGQVAPLTRCLHRIQCNTRTQFPDLRLIQYDCGKLQTLHTLLRKLKTGGHRVLIFTQMTRMLDVLEQFLNYHGHIYLRLDGSTRVEQRQALMERFNADRRIFCFILSTRSGGVGVNLTGADTVVFYDSDWNPTMDAQAQDRCHRIGQTRDVHIYRLISERTVEENILKKANQKRMLGDMAIEGGNFTTAFFKQQTIRELFDVNDGERREVAVELALPQPEEEDGVNKQSTTILEQALCRAEDEEDIVAASQAKAEQVAELAEFNENIPLDDGGEQEEVEELSKAEQEIAALVEQLTPIERYAMNFLEASLEDVCKEELKQAEEQVEAARKGLDQAKEEGLKLHASSDDDDNDFLSSSTSVEPAQPVAIRRGRKPKDKDKIVTSTRTSGRLRGASPEIEPESTTPKEVPERLRLRGRGAAVSNSPSRSDILKSSSSTSKSSKASSPARDNQSTKTRTLSNRSHTSPVPSPPTVSPSGGKQHFIVGSETKSPKASIEPKDVQAEGRPSESSPASTSSVDHHLKDDESKDHSAMFPPSTGIRSPRKRQSADGEVLRGLVEDSPSAKVLRKLPGRLVTVVEEKEPKKRRRRGSGTGGMGSSEDTAVEETLAGSGDEPNHNNSNTSPSDDGKAKEALNKSPQSQNTTPKSLVHPPPVRAYPPYSPPHLSPDMPVLRNLPVRRRLETESRMAAQLGEQQHLGRGRGATLKKTDASKDATSTSTESGVLTPLKRKRGRPPKAVLKLPESDNTLTSRPQVTSPSEEENPSPSSKPKKGRLSVSDNVSEEQSSKCIDSAAGSDVIKMDHGKQLPEIPKADPLSLIQASESTTANQTDNKIQGSPVSATDFKKTLESTTKETEDLISVSEPPDKTSSNQIQPASFPSSNTTSAQVSATPSTSVTLPDTAALTTTSPLPTVSTGLSCPPAVEPKPFTSAVHVDPKTADCTAVKTELEAAKTRTVSTSVASAPPTETLKVSPPAASVPDPIVMSSTAGVVSGATNKVSAPSTISATGEVLTQVTEQTVNIVAETSIPAVITSNPEESSARPSTNVAFTETITASAVETVQACPSPNLVNTVLKGQQTVSDSSLTPVSAEFTSSVDTVPSCLVQTGPDTNIPSKQLQKLPEQTKTEDTAAVSSPVQSVYCIPPQMCAQNVDTTEAKLDNVISSTASTDLVTVEEKSNNTVTSPEKTFDTSSRINTNADATQDVHVTTTPSSEMLPTSSSTTAVETSHVSITTPSSASVTTTTGASTKTESFISSLSQNSAGHGASLEVPEFAQNKSSSKMPISAPSNVSWYKPSTESVQEESASKSDINPKEIQTGTLETNTRTNEEGEEDEDNANKQEKTKSIPKRSRLESSSVTKQVESEKEEEGECSRSKTNLQEEAELSEAEETIEDQSLPKHKRSLSRQSSQESTCSSSPSSGASTSALTRHSHHKRTYENRHPVKKRRTEVSTEAASEKKMKEDKEEGSKTALSSSSSSQKRRSRSSSSSSDSDDSKGKKEHLFTRSAKQRKVQDQEKERGNARSGKKPASSTDRHASSRANASTGGESGSDTSSVRVTRKSSGSRSSQDGKCQLKSSPPAPVEPEVLGKRCSALNAAAKLLAMKGRVDTPGHTPRKDSATKSAGTTPASSSFPDKNQKPKNKSVPASSQTNSVTNNKGPDTKPLTTTTQSSRSPSRSTRQCPGSLVPPLDLEFKRSRSEKKERGTRKMSRSKEGEADAQSSSRGHSACSSMSSDGEADVGRRSSRSRSSSNSSQRTRSISSRVMEHKESGSLATSSGSERDTDRSSDRAKSKDKRERQGQKMDSGKGRKRSLRLSQELTNSSGTEGTPDRVLRSVAALAAVQARSPAASTRSSSSQLHRNKT